MSSNHISYDSYMLALELSRSGVTDVTSFLIWKRFELEKIQLDNIFGGCRGYVFFIIFSYIFN
ncbi:hypothetical protein LbFV_ORF44 [Leptopilina boulardi filamentous virus]|uniref:Uncharacterized protein n=1 Tax=Leptopilina boulardi filamentous virus TaxID=552509 RepID=A0A1S5YD96_9VIRU|nr:hypothetical protein LbFV_ORF44 [Leptopilina boulardi filamentous virus]AQQ79964.1 hypothetical protein LbFV_ORF44 [Leptopilina boulardi filamentous virus]